MPQNKKEGIIFTSIMCFLMVLGMSLYNLWLNNDVNILSLLKGFIPGLIVAFILDVFIVGPVAKKIAFKLPINKSSKIQMILSISTCMIIGMVLSMSVFGIVIENQLEGNILSTYLHAITMNFIVALPLQLLVVGPISRLILSKIQENTMSEIVE